LGPYNYLNPAIVFFIEVEVPVPTPGSQRYVYVYLGIDFYSLYEFPIGIWNDFDSGTFLFFILLSEKVGQHRRGNQKP
jgi:hypothetical protein